MKENQKSLPEWYWTRGLHDAKILSVSELQLTPNYLEKNPKINCFKIELDCDNAMYEYNIKTIRLYNYKIKSNDLDINLLNGGWWLSDEIINKGDQYYFLNIKFDTAKCKTKHLEIAFKQAEVIRK